MAEVYENVWTWEGRGEESHDTSATIKDYEPPPQDPFPFEGVRRACEITILAETTAKFQEEMAKIGITTAVTKIEPEVWIETKLDVYTRQTRWWTYYDYVWHHWLHMKANVYFTSDKPITESPIAELTLAALVAVIKWLAIVIAAALVIYYIAAKFIDSFFVETHIIRTHDPTTCQWTEEIIKKPKWEMGIWLVLGIVAVLSTIIIVPKLLEARKK